MDSFNPLTCGAGSVVPASSQSVYRMSCVYRLMLHPTGTRQSLYASYVRAAAVFCIYYYFSKKEVSASLITQCICLTDIELNRPGEMVGRLANSRHDAVWFVAGWNRPGNRCWCTAFLMRCTSVDITILSATMTRF